MPSTLDVRNTVISELRKTLRWSEPPETLLRVGNTFYRTTMLSSLDHLSHATGDGEIHSRMDILPGNSRNRLLFAPEFFRAVMTGQRDPSGTYLSLQTFLRLEEYLFGRGECPPKGSWSALGDVYVGRMEGDRDETSD